MNRAADERKRRLARVYELVAERRAYLGGFAPHPSPLKKLLKEIEYNLLPHYFGPAPRWRLFLRRLASDRTHPDFCIAGPIKSGSSDLALNIFLHPAIIAPISKEFPVDPDTWRFYYPTRKHKERHARIHGAALSPILLPFLHQIDLIHVLATVRPNAKIILPLREPTKRAYSHWKWDYFLAGEKRARTLPFLADFAEYIDKALELFPDCPMYSACGFPVLQTSIYWQAVTYWIQHFGRDRVLVIDVDECWREPQKSLHKIHDFLGIPRYDTPGSMLRTNENPLTLPPPDVSTMKRLKAFFKPYNDKLWSVIGTEFDW